MINSEEYTWNLRFTKWLRFLSVFFWSLCFLFFFDWWILITSLWYHQTLCALEIYLSYLWFLRIFFTLTWKFGCLLNIYIDNIQRVILSGAWLDIEINCNVNFEADLKKKDYWKSRSDITLPLGGNNDLECYEVVSMLLAEIGHRGNIMLNIEWQRNIACNF